MRNPTVAIIGGESLLARELRDLLSTQAPGVRVKLVGLEAGGAILTEEEGEAAVIGALEADSLTAACVAFLAGTPASSRRALELVSRSSPAPVLIDLTCALEDRPGSVLGAPLVEPPNRPAPLGGLHVIAHPAAIVLADFLRRLHQAHPLRRSVVHVFEPASERGKGGVEELQQQTVQLLSFRSLPKQIFDEQLCFNLLARYGYEAPESLASIEVRIERHLATLLSEAGQVPMPSIRLIQAPVFHGYSFSVWAEFEGNPGQAALAEALASERIEVRTGEEEAPTNAGVAGQSGMTVGLIETDRNDPRSAWFWIVADNLRASAENAVSLARLLIPGEGTA